MSFDLATFLFQLVNFLVLVLVLHRVLWKPLSRHMASRRRRIDDGLEEIARGRAELEEERAAIEAKWDEARRAVDEARDRAECEADERRAELLEEARRAAHDERERVLAGAEAERRRHEEEFLRALTPSVGRALRGLLGELGGGDLHERACRTFAASLAEFDEEARTALREAARAGTVRLESATGAVPDALREAARALLGVEAEMVDADPDLVAGARLIAGDRTVDGSVRAQVERLLEEVP